MLVRLLVAAALGALLGWEREHAHKPAGLRTHMLVGIAAALYTAIAELSVSNIPPNSQALQADPIRVIQAVAIGVGFLGSGVIFVRPQEHRVRGLTTAASVWATAAVGVAAGLGYFVLAGTVTALLLLVLRVLVRFDAQD
jgi:putative Mg2+ transporter-C (MgtC) family protein